MSETPQKGSHAQGDDKLQRQASQLAYDVKYKVKQKLGKDSKLSPAQVTKAYMQQLAASPAPAGVKALAKKKLVGEEHTSFMHDSAKDLVLETLTKVFIEGIEEKVEEEVVSEAEEKKYKVRVTDKASGNTYVTNATRAKIAELRANKNISSVEMTGYGTPIQAKADGGKKAKKDYDGDGKVESGSKEHAGAVHNAIQRKKGGVPDGKDTRREEVEYVEEDSRRTSNKQHTKRVRQNIKAFGSNYTPPNNYDPDANRGKGEVVTRKQIEKKRRKALRQEEVIYETEEKDGEKKITGKGVNNKKLIKIMPNLGEQVGTEDPKQKQLDQQKLSNLKRLQMKKQQLDRQRLNLQKQGKLPMGEEKKVEEKDEDERAKPTKMSLIKNKMRSRGIQVAGLDIAPRNMKTGGELDEAKNGGDNDPCWDTHKQVGMKKKGGKMVPNCVPKEEVELDERTRYAKETGKDPQTGKESKKGGDKPPAAFAKVSADLRKTGGMMSSRKKPIQPQGKKKEKGKKGYQGPTPVDKIRGKLARKRAPKPDIGSRFD